MSLVVRAGTVPLVLVAPHGGRRDAARRPWGSAPLRMNDLHTAALAEELAVATGGALLANVGLDRNEVDLNRLSAALHDRPDFLRALDRLVADACARHGRCTVLVVHGWNVVQPVVDLGLGCTPAADPLAVGDGAGVSPAFARHGVAALIAACRARGIVATVGARYPACARENLIQLFTGRHRDHADPLVRRLAAHVADTDAVQVELGVPLRWPGPWRERLVHAICEALPALLATPPARDSSAAGAAAPPPRRGRAVAQAIEFAGPGLAGLASVDAGGGRLLLFPGDGTLLLFTGERTSDAPGTVGGLQVQHCDGAGLALRFAGPLARFPDTTPFLDLEQGLARATILPAARVALDFVSDHPAADPTGDFGRACGRVRAGALETSVDAVAVVRTGPPRAPWPRLQAALRLGDGRGLSVTVPASAEGPTSGFLCEGGRHRAVEAVAARFGPADAPLDALALDVRVDGGPPLRVHAEAVHRLPVVRGGTAPAVRLFYAACRVAGAPGTAGWCQLHGY